MQISNPASASAPATPPIIVTWADRPKDDANQIGFVTTPAARRQPLMAAPSDAVHPSFLEQALQQAQRLSAGDAPACAVMYTDGGFGVRPLPQLADAARTGAQLVIVDRDVKAIVDDNLQSVRPGPSNVVEL